MQTVFKLALVPGIFTIAVGCSGNDDNNRTGSVTNTPQETTETFKWTSVTLVDDAIVEEEERQLSDDECVFKTIFTVQSNGDFTVKETECKGITRTGKLSEGELRELSAVIENISLEEAQAKLKCTKYEDPSYGFNTNLSLKTSSHSYLLYREEPEQFCDSGNSNDADSLVTELRALRYDHFDSQEL